MGETKASNGVSGNNTAKKKEMSVKEVSAQKLEKKLREYSGENPIYVAGIDFGVRERDAIEISNNNNTDTTGDTDTSARNANENGLIIADNTVTKSIETVLGPGVLIVTKKRVKSDKNRENDEKEEQQEQQESRE